MRTITNVFLLNLAISDILLGVLCMPVTLVGTLLRHFIFGEFFCKLIQFSQAASVAVSSWTLVAISCERYYAICHPLRSRRWQTRSHAYKIIAIIWCGSMLCMLPIAMFSQLMPTSRPGLRKCRENWPSLVRPYERSYNLILSLILLVLPLVILSVAYILITRTLYVGMRVEKAMIFDGRQEDTESSMKSKTLNGSRLEKHSFLSASLLSSNTASLLRTKLNLSMRCPEAAAATVSYNAAGDASSHRQGNLEKTTHETETFCQQKQLHHHHQKQQQQQQSHRLYPQYNFPNCHQQLEIESRELQSHEQHCCEPFARFCCKRSTNVSSGRPHLYCMRFATLKTTALAATEGNGKSNFCTADCCFSSGNTASLNSSTSNSNVISATEASTSASMPTMYRYQLNHPLGHTQAHCYCLVPQMVSQLHRKTEAKCSLNNKRSLKITESVLRRNNIAKNLESKKRVVKMLFVLVLEFFICWTPLYVINTAAMYIGSAIYEYIDYTSISVLQLLAYSSSCCNPITYCFMNANFRRAFWDTFKDMQWCGKQFQRKRSTNQNDTKLCLAGSVRVNSCTVQTIIDSPRL